MDLIQKLLPIECYSSARRDFVPRKLSVDGIVQHYFSGKYAFPDDKFNLEKCWQLMHDLNFNPGDRKYDLYNSRKVYASAHFMIGRAGEIWQLVPTEYQAYHAGKSEWHGRKGCNGFMVGIENIGSYGVDYTDDQYESNSALCASLMKDHLFDLDMIAGHDKVSPGRKKDPGPNFDWARLHDIILSN